MIIPGAPGSRLRAALELRGTVVGPSVDFTVPGKFTLGPVAVAGYYLVVVSEYDGPEVARSSPTPMAGGEYVEIEIG